MEQYVHVILRVVAQTDLNTLPTEVVEDILAGTDLYNQAVEEQRALSCSTQLRTAALQLANLRLLKGHHPASFSVKNVTVILAAHHAETTAERLHWLSEKPYQTCFVSITCRSSAVEWTWEKLHDTYLNTSFFLNDNQQPSVCHSAFLTTPLCILNLYSDTSFVKTSHATLTRPAPAQHSKQTHVHPSAHLLSEVFQQDHSSAESLFQVLVSSTNLLAPLVSHTNVQPLQNTVPDLLPLNDPLILKAQNLNAADSVESYRPSAKPKNNIVEGTWQEWANLEIISRVEAAAR